MLPKIKFETPVRNNRIFQKFEGPKTAENQIWGLFRSFFGFESVSIQFLTPKNIGKLSKILKIGSEEAEIANLVKNWLF